MATEKVITKVAEHDAANLKTTDSAAEEAELQARIAATTKPLEAPAIAAPNPVAAAQVADSKERLRAVVMVGPDGEPLPTITREQRLELALSNLVKKLALISSHPDFKGVFAAAVAQNLPLDFPNWKQEVDAAKALIE